VSRSLKAHLLLILITLIWGSTFVLIKQALEYSSPLLFNTVRMALASVLLMVFYRRHLRQITWPALSAGAVIGVFLFLGYAFQTTGLRLTTPSKSAFLTGSSNVLVPLLLVLLWRVRIHPWRVAGVFMAFAGLFLMTVPAGRQGLADFARVNFGDLLTLGCALAFAFHIIFLGHATQRFAFQQIAVLQVAAAAVLMALSVPVLEKSHWQLSPLLLLAIVITGSLCTAVAFAVQSWAQQFTPATHTALIFTMEPVFAWITSYVYLHERLGFRAAAGALLILAGVLISELLGSVSRPEPELAGVPASSAR